jgi:hypothetical protein
MFEAGGGSSGSCGGPLGHAPNSLPKTTEFQPSKSRTQLPSSAGETCALTTCSVSATIALTFAIWAMQPPGAQHRAPSAVWVLTPGAGQLGVHL